MLIGAIVAGMWFIGGLLKEDDKDDPCKMTTYSYYYSYDSYYGSCNEEYNY